MRYFAPLVGITLKVQPQTDLKELAKMIPRTIRIIKESIAYGTTIKMEVWMVGEHKYD